MGQMNVEKNVGGIKGLCVITPACMVITVTIMWRNIDSEIRKKRTLILSSFRTISLLASRSFCVAYIFRSIFPNYASESDKRLRV